MKRIGMKQVGTGRIVGRMSALTLALTLALVGGLGSALPAHAWAPGDPGAPDVAGQTATSVTGVSELAPDAVRLPTGRARTERAPEGAAMTLGGRAAASTERTVEAAQEGALGCTPYISRLVTGSGLDVRIDYLAEIVCNFYLAGTGQAYLIERTAGSPYQNQVVAAAGRFTFVNDYYGYSLGAVLIDGRVYDGGSQMEIGFDLALQTLNGATWAGCFELPPGHRYLSPCAGLGTRTVSVSIGSGVFGTSIPPNRLALLSSWTQPGADSYAEWDAARQNQGAWAAYRFDWSTDLCTWAPDNPLGFAFELACVRHDFGYRNYKAAQRFEANKDRLDLAFYGDLQRICATYPDSMRPACYALATIYYEAARLFGVPQVTDEQLEAAAELLPEATVG